MGNPTIHPLFKSIINYREKKKPIFVKEKTDK